MTISSVQLTDTFDTWRIATNSVIAAVNASIESTVLANLTTSTKTDLIASINEVNQRGVIVGTTGGTSDAITVTPLYTVSAIVTGSILVMTTISANTTTTPTVNVASKGAKTIVRVDGSAVRAGSLAANTSYILVYDGTYFRIINRTDLTLTDLLPTQTGNSGKYLTTDGTTASWGSLSTLPTQTGNSGKYLTTDGTNASWSNISNVLLGTSSLSTPALRIATETNTGIGQIGSSGTLSVVGQGGEILRATGVASAVNYATITNAATGNSIAFGAAGTDSTISILYKSKGPGAHFFQTNTTDTQFAINPTAGATNYLTVNGSNGGAPAFVAQGSSTNIDIQYSTKGAAGHYFATNGANQFRVLGPASATNYATISGSVGGAPQITTSGGNLSIKAATNRISLDGSTYITDRGDGVGAALVLVGGNSEWHTYNVTSTGDYSFFHFKNQAGTNVSYDTLVLQNNGVVAIKRGAIGAVVALTDGATITPDFSLANYFTLTLGGNRTLTNPTNLVAGQSGTITIRQDATGNRTLAYGSYWKFRNATVPPLSTAANAVDKLVFDVVSSTEIHATLLNGFG